MSKGGTGHVIYAERPHEFQGDWILGIHRSSKLKFAPPRVDCTCEWSAGDFKPTVRCDHLIA